MMFIPEGIDERLWYLINADCDGTIGEEETRELGDLLDSDHRALAFYVDFLTVNADILWLVSAKQHGARVLQGDMPPVADPHGHPPIVSFLDEWASFFRHHSPLWFVLFFLLFSVALVGTTYWLTGQHSAEAPADAACVAQITAEKGSQWSTSITPPTEMMRLRVGQQLQLETGMAQITYSNNATVLLQGPASFTVASPNSGFLSQGKLTARAEKEQAGQFAIITPDARFIDLGTEFGVMIDDKGHVAAAVFSGKVKAEAKLPDGRWTTGISIREGEAVVCEAANFTRLVAQRSNFPSLQPLPPPPQYQRWLEASQKLQKNPDLLAYYDFQPDPDNPKILRNRAPTGAALDGEIQNAAWIDGRFTGKRALEFMAADAGVRVNLPGKYQQMTLIAWVNSKQLMNKYNGILLSDGWLRTGQLHWQLRASRQIETNIFGQNIANEAYCSTEAVTADQLGRWCMISAVIDTPDRCTLYINGDYFQQLKSVKIPAIEIGAAMIGGWNKEDSPDKDIIRTLSGRIDELAIFTKALSAKDIKDIYETGEPGDFPAPRPSASYLRWQAQNRELQQRQDLVAYYDFQAEGNNDKVLVNRL